MYQSSHFYILTVCGRVHRPLLDPVESLLQMLLLWDPVARGGIVDVDTNKPYCNTALQNILNMKVSLASVFPLETLLHVFLANIVIVGVLVFVVAVTTTLLQYLAGAIVC